MPQSKDDNFKISEPSLDLSVSRETKNSKLRLFRLLLILILIFALVPIAAVGWNDLYKKHVETTPPEIRLIHFPRGLGLEPVEVKFAVFDLGAGLDSLVVRVRQKSTSKIILKEKLKGIKSKEYLLTLSKESFDGFLEGLFYLDIKVFDNALWSNAVEESVEMSLDFKRPKLEIISQQHNGRRGGSQLLFYRASDLNLAWSGVVLSEKVRFKGYPATFLDPEISDSSIFAVVYGLPLDNQVRSPDLKVVAEDTVGNLSETVFSNRIAERSPRNIKTKISLGAFSKQVDLQKLSLNQDNLENQLPTLVENLLEKSEKKLQEALRSAPSYPARNFKPLVPAFGTETLSYGDRQNLFLNDSAVASFTSGGNEYSSSNTSELVPAAGDGVVVLSGDFGIYGKMVGIDHGLGLVSVYGYIREILVKFGDSVETGQALGRIGFNGFTGAKRIYFSTRVQGVPVDPREWMSKGWFEGHITEKINFLRRSLGMQIFVPFS
ncbi:MAG TPA: M23 family metallopeptidase [Oligoflexia bacterium]|nr:M23 family metallopeptidase [Oligoflexia bacterium]HMP26956.1 M23 family metallopeptidase [Oligoflexia bacterium]